MAIIKRGDRYGVRVCDPARRRHRWLGTFAKLSDAKRAEADATLRPKAAVARATHRDYGDEFAALIVFAAYTGVRPGELAALQWHDLDPANREATIGRALDGQGGVKPPKNGLERTIILPPPVLAALGEV